MTFDFLTMYLIIATFYVTIFLSIKILAENVNFPPLLIGFISMIVSVFIGWLIFPFLLFYNLFIRKALI